MKKFTIKTLKHGEQEIEAEAILANDVEFTEKLPNTNQNRLFIIGHVFGAVAAVWATNLQDALDVATDADLLDCFKLSDEDSEKYQRKRQADEDWDDESVEQLGNYSENFNLSDMWHDVALINGSQDWRLVAAFAEAHGVGYDNLSEVRLV